MTKHEAVFEIESKSDAYAVERLVDRVYDTIREESQTVRSESAESTSTLQAFEALREAVRGPTAGQLTIVYEEYDEALES